MKSTCSIQLNMRTRHCPWWGAVFPSILLTGSFAGTRPDRWRSATSIPWPFAQDQFERAADRSSGNRSTFLHETVNEVRVQKTETTDDTIARRATSTPTPRDDEHQQLANIQSLEITKQIDEVLNDMKSLLTHGREVVIQHQNSTASRKESKIPEKIKSRRTRKERVTVPSLE